MTRALQEIVDEHAFWLHEWGLNGSPHYVENAPKVFSRVISYIDYHYPSNHQEIIDNLCVTTFLGDTLVVKDNWFKIIPKEKC